MLPVSKAVALFGKKAVSFAKDKEFKHWGAFGVKDFVLAADDIEIPEAFDLTADELDVIKNVSDNPFNLISLGFKCGFMRGQRATKLPANVLHMLAQADERQLKLIAGFVRQLVKKGGAT